MNPITTAKRLLELSERASPENWPARVLDFEAIPNTVANCAFIVEARNHAPEIAKLFLEAVEVIKETYYVCICDGWYEHDNVVRNPDCSSCQAGEFLKKIRGGG